MDRILVIEDDEDISRLLCRVLEKDGYQAEAAYSGTEAKLVMEQGMPDLVLLDLMLPGMNGEEITDYIRNQKKWTIPIIVLSAKTAMEHKLEMITMGADDYITKPFDPKEVSVRVMAALRRHGGAFGGGNEGGGNEGGICQYKNLALYPDSRSAAVSGEEIPLTRYEYEILFILMQQPQKVFSRETLYEKVWNNGYYGEDNTVNVHISNIRKKIAAVDKENEYIKTVWGIGFKMA